MKSKRPRVVVFYGGESPNHDLSKETGYWVCQYVPRSSYDVTPVEITANGKWKVPLGNLPRTGSVRRTMDMLSKAVRPLPASQAIQRLMDKPIDAFITVVRGRGGDDGATHSIGEALNIPVVGSSHETCQNTANKHTFAQYVGDIVSTPYTRRYRATTPVEEIIEEVQNTVMPPVFIKPTTQEGSYGIEYVEHLDDLPAAIRRARSISGDVLLQEQALGTELSLTLVEDKRGAVHVLPPTIISPKKAPYYDHASKRRAGRTELITPKTIDDPAVAEAAFIARDVFDELNCDGIATVDMISHDGTTDVFEVNTVPTLTDLTPLMHQLKAAGLHPTALLECLIQRRIG